MENADDLLNVGDVFQLDISNKDCGPYAGKYFKVISKENGRINLSSAYDDEGLKRLSKCNGMVRL